MPNDDSATGDQNDITLRDVINHMQHMEQRLSGQIKENAQGIKQNTQAIADLNVSINDRMDQLDRRINALDEDLTATIEDSIKIFSYISLLPKPLVLHKFSKKCRVAIGNR